ncbi:ABC transporter permease [Oscillatoria amoena NRMC-F 0135]|nr:ABC transporter permease [Oscillatoria amoena NRMC-F 0135]
MKQIWLVTQREYLSRVKKKSFIIMTLLGPLLIALFYGAIIWVMVNEAKKDKEHFIQVIDESGLVKNQLKNNKQVLFGYTDDKIEDARKNLDSTSFYGILYFPPSFTLERPVGVQLFTREQSSLSTQQSISSSIENELKSKRMQNAGLSAEKIDSLDVDIDLNVLVNSGGETKKSETAILTGIGFALTFLMYMFVFIYGVQVMRGVMEEKTNRIVEVVISTVRPFQLMMGKILGIAMVGLTQFIMWAILGTGLIFVISLIFGVSGAADASQQMQTMPGAMQPDKVEMAEQMAEMMVGSGISTALIIKYLLIFLFYFIFGYLMYSSLFAAVGSAVDNETDTQQFMFPITIPIVFSFIVSVSSITNDPHSTLAWWLSIIPLTSPVTMMARLPFIEGHEWDLALSMLLLIGGFIGSTWFAGRIYRTGILMYGKKPTYKELWKWLRYKG